MTHKMHFVKIYTIKELKIFSFSFLKSLAQCFEATQKQQRKCFEFATALIRASDWLLLQSNCS